jgi:hypothetical protein
VDPYNPFYIYIRCLYCRGIVSGYSSSPPCTTGTPCFLPYSYITRAQVAKMVSLAAGENDPVPSTQQTFADVTYNMPFWQYIERLAGRGIISGYDCGGAGEPCDPLNRPYFRPYANITRGQLAKIDANAAGYSDVPPSTAQTFEDVLYGSPFWLYIERLARRGIISGYDCGSGPGEPCVPPLNRPYYRPYVNITRAQTSKIVANTFFPLNCAPGPQQ